MDAPQRHFENGQSEVLDCALDGTHCGVLDSRMASAIRLSHWKCVFAKIKGMIADMIEKLDQEGQKLLSSSSGATRKCVRKESIENDDKMDLCASLQ